MHVTNDAKSILQERSVMIIHDKNIYIYAQGNLFCLFSGVVLGKIDIMNRLYTYTAYFHISV